MSQHGGPSCTDRFGAPPTVCLCARRSFGLHGRLIAGGGLYRPMCVSAPRMSAPTAIVCRTVQVVAITWQSRRLPIPRTSSDAPRISVARCPLLKLPFQECHVQLHDRCLRPRKCERSRSASRRVLFRDATRCLSEGVMRSPRCRNSAIARIPRGICPPMERTGRPGAAGLRSILVPLPQSRGTPRRRGVSGWRAIVGFGGLDTITGRNGYARHRTDGLRAFVHRHGRLESEQECSSLHPLHNISPV